MKRHALKIAEQLLDDTIRAGFFKRFDPVEVMRRYNLGEIDFPTARKMMRTIGKGLPAERGTHNIDFSSDVKGATIFNKAGIDNRLKISSFESTPMIDIDLPRASHYEMSVTAGTAGEALDQLRDFAGANQAYLTTFMTKGGIRAFDLSHAERPMRFYGRKLATKTGDPMYSAHTMTRNRFDARVSGKDFYEKEGIDYIAAPLLDLAAPGAKINPLNRYNVEKFHNDIIKSQLHSSKESSRPGRARAEIIKDVKRLLDTVSGRDADVIVNTMKEGGIF
jgi:hypothetical protein